VRARRKISSLLIALLLLSMHAIAQMDSSPHKVQLVAVEQGVQLEVLDHLGDDVLAVMKVLHIERPVLVGHSLAGTTMCTSPTKPGSLLR
jgi:hypothetical protein